VFNKFDYILGNNKRKLLIAVILTCTSTIFIAVVNPLILKLIFDEASIKSNFNRFLLLSFLSIFLFTAWRVANYFISLNNEAIKNSCKKYLINHLMIKYFDSDSRNIKEQSEGYYVARLIDEAESTVDSALEFIFEFSGSIAGLIGSLIVILYISIYMTAALALTVPILMIFSKYFSSKIRDISNLVSENSAEIRKSGNKMLRAQIFVKMHSLSETVVKIFNNQYDNVLSTNFSLHKLNRIFGSASSIIFSWIESVVIIFGGLAILNKYFSFGDFMGFMNGFWVAINSINALINMYPSRISIDTSIQRLKNIDEELSRQSKLYMSSDKIQFENLNFSREKKVIFKDLNLSLQIGSRILIIGSNGSGKTTLGNLMANLLSYDSGKVVSLPRISAMIEPVFAPPIKLTELVNHNHERIDIVDDLVINLKLEQIFDQYVDEMSLGQRKRALIAVTLLKDADLYIFDEPLANIDGVSQSDVFNSILEFTKGKTLVLIMHEYEHFLPKFDKIVDLNAIQSGLGVQITK
jgi:ABC-type multidrug transport system fused ATPase/permease subunit